MTTADPALEAQDPDSLEDAGQEPGEVEGPPTPEAEATDPDAAAAADEAVSAEQPDGEQAAPEGRPRDEQGRFISAEATPPESGPSPAEAPPPEPFGFKVDGVPVEVEGATERDGVIQIPRAAWDSHVQNRLADRGRLQQREERMAARIRDLEGARAREKSEKELRAEKILQRVDKLLGDPNALLEFAKNYQSEAPKLKLEIENEILRSQSQASQERIKERDTEADQRYFEENARPALKNVVASIAAEHKGVDAAKVADELWGLWETGVPIFFRVKENDGSGLDPNEHKFGVDLERIRKLSAPFLKLHARTETQKQAEAVEQQNAKVVGKKKAPPPTVPAAGSPTPGGVERTFKSAEEFKQHIAEKYKIPVSTSG